MFEKNFRNETIELRGIKVGLGVSKLIKFTIDRLPTGTLIEIPVYVFNGKKLGPTILLQGGLHGDETNSIEIIRRMLENDYFKIERGCVIVVPLLSVFGFLHFSRDVHGKDVNRSFPGTKTGSLASRIAYLHMREIVGKIDFGIDYHTGGNQRSNYPQIRYTEESEVCKELAEIFNAPFYFPSKLINKSFRKEAYKHNIPIIVYEGGEALRFDEVAIKEGIEGTLRILEHFKMISKSTIKIAKKSNSIHLNKRRWIRAKIAGLFNSFVHNGDKVVKGQIIGDITDTYGETSVKVKSPISGYIIAINYFPVINRGDAIFHLGDDN
jgi:predicted deacylase